MSESSNSSIYLDYNATTPLDTEVIDTITEVLHRGWANPSSQYADGKYANRIVWTSRHQIKEMINAKEAKGKINVFQCTYYSLKNFLERCYIC